MEQIVSNFIEMFGNDDAFAAATPEQIARLRELIGEQSAAVLDFYSRYQPNNVPMTESYVRLVDIDTIIAENTVGEPGKYLAQYGVFVFALTVGGNVICIDTNDIRDGNPSVLIADASFCAYNESCGCVEISVAPDEIMEECDDDILRLDYENIVRCLPRIEDSFTEFMSKLSNDEYEDVEEYLE
ncbi:MAG: hypothetical protein E7559_03700 [Ruminococcaceae bacterium]|nr:hypothetical protein [Oscillospiraceae bacterium]